MYDILNSIFGLELSSHALTLGNVTARAFLVYFIGMFLVRIQSQFMEINTPFNYMLNFILGSLLANAIVGEGSYFAVLGMTLFILLMNYTIALLCFYSPVVEKFFKGEKDILVDNGKIIWKNMRKNLITKDELMEAVHKHIHSNNLADVKKVYFENSGEITVTKK